MSATPMMTAVEVERPGKISLVELERPQPGPDEVLVRVAAVGICGSDVELIHELGLQRGCSLIENPVRNPGVVGGFQGVVQRE